METLHPPAPRLPLPVAPRAAIGALVADLLIAIGMALILSVAVVGVIIGLRAAQTGLDVNTPGQLNPQEITRLIGVDGMLTLLVLQNLVFIGVAVIRVRVLRREPLAVLGFSAPQPLRLALFGVGLGVLALFVNGIVGMIFVSAGIRQNRRRSIRCFPAIIWGRHCFLSGRQSWRRSVKKCCSAATSSAPPPACGRLARWHRHRLWRQRTGIRPGALAGSQRRGDRAARSVVPDRSGVRLGI
jgi:uncharacterized membrane protein YedE/YeeE